MKNLHTMEVSNDRYLKALLSQNSGLLQQCVGISFANTEHMARPLNPKR